jgi:hypothetical protein
MTDYQQNATAPKLAHQPSSNSFFESMAAVWRRKTTVIAAFAAAAILVYLILRFAIHTSPGTYKIPLLATLALGGIPLLFDLLKKLWKREFGSDLLAGISIVTSVLLGEYLAGSIVVLMLSGGEALEHFAVRSASSVLRALAKRMPSIAHRKRDSAIIDMALAHARHSDGSCALAYRLVWIQTVSQPVRTFHRYLWVHWRSDCSSLVALPIGYRHADWRRSELGNGKGGGRETPNRVNAQPLDFCYRLALPFLPALAWALALAVMFTPFHRWLEPKPKHPNLAASVSILVVGLVIRQDRGSPYLPFNPVRARQEMVEARHTTCSGITRPVG